MGSYRQPSQVLDTSHSIINKGIEGIYSNISEQLKQNKKALLAQEKENQKLLKQKKLDEIKRVNDLSKIDQKRRQANLYVANLVNNTPVSAGEVIFGNQISGIKGIGIINF